jgi:hypothetical protein
MPIRMFHIGFEYVNPGFPKTDIISQHFSDPDDKIVFDIRESNVLVIGNSVQPNDIPNIVNFNKGPKILYVGEPIGKFEFSHIFDQIFAKNMYDYAIGCISNNPSMNWIKCPFYYNMATNLKEVNAYVSTTQLEKKNVCTMINRHDPGNTRLPILRELSKYMHVVCPGRLANNCSSEEVDRLGTPEYIKKFIFNICSENFADSHPGYITEKLMNCCLGGAIPIYFGNLDEIDQQIFNKERILFLNANNVEEVAKRVMQLCLNRELIEQFYRQPVFRDTAEEAVKSIGDGVKTFFKGNLGSLLIPPF